LKAGRPLPPNKVLQRATGAPNKVLQRATGAPNKVLQRATGVAAGQKSGTPTRNPGRNRVLQRATPAEIGYSNAQLERCVPANRVLQRATVDNIGYSSAQLRQIGYSSAQLASSNPSIDAGLPRFFPPYPLTFSIYPFLNRGKTPRTKTGNPAPLPPTRKGINGL
jgi:hypothetical protein